MGNEKNIDLIFYGVEFMNVPAMFEGLKIDQVENPELNHLSKLTYVDVREGWTYRLTTEGKEFYIICAHFHIKENELSFMETSLTTPRKGLGIG